MATSTTVPSPAAGAGGDAEQRSRRRASRRRLPWWCIGLGWLVIVGLIVLAGYEFFLRTDARPSYDAFGWMVWGRQVVLHGKLNTDGAPSWKPLTFLFTLPYALFGRTQLNLWTVTASAAALASSVFAARIAFRLTGLNSRRVAVRWPAVVAALFAGAGVLGMTGLSHQMLIATSDPMVVTLCLAAVDAHLSRRPRLAFAMVVLASLGRPETWAFAFGYAIWCWRSVRRMRPLVLLGLLLIPAGWFVIPALTSHSWFISGDLALNFPDQIHGNKIVGVFDRFTSLYELPMQIAALVALGLAGLRRDRTQLTLAAMAALWVAIEIAFAYHGWPASQRYLMEPAAVMIALAGAAVGRVLDFVARGARALLLPAAFTRHAFETWLLRGVGLGAVVVLALALVPVARSRVRLWRSEIHHAQVVSVPIDQLPGAVALAGGPALIRRCGQPVTFVGFQSTLAWNLNMNVGNVGYKPGRAIHGRKPIVFFAPFNGGWLIRPIHTRARNLAACARVALDYEVIGPPAKPGAGLPPALAREVRNDTLGPFYVPRRLRPAVRHHARPRPRRHVAKRVHRRGRGAARGGRRRGLHGRGRGAVRRGHRREHAPARRGGHPPGRGKAHATHHAKGHSSRGGKGHGSPGGKGRATTPAHPAKPASP